MGAGRVLGEVYEGLGELYGAWGVPMGSMRVWGGRCRGWGVPMGVGGPGRVYMGLRGSLWVLWGL